MKKNNTKIYSIFIALRLTAVNFLSRCEALTKIRIIQRQVFGHLNFLKFSVLQHPYYKYRAALATNSTISIPFDMNLYIGLCLTI